MLQFIILLSLLPQQTGGLLDAVNSERGGRHWIDQKPDPPKSPEESLACFQIEPGSRIELVASEPLVIDPVWMDFDHLGRLFVVEYTDYPIGPVKADGTVDESAASLSKIVMLEDLDGDGRMDKRTVFADGLTFCHSFLPLMDGILACAQSQIIYLKDTDGDNVADVREVWFDGFVAAHPQMQIGCPRWGLDNWIYLTYAPGNVRCLRPGFESKEPVKMPRQDMRFHPLTMKFEPISGLGQFGNTIDNDGHRFFCTNRNPIMMEMIPEAVARRNPFVTIGKRHTDVGPSGGDTKVFPLVDMKSNWLAHAGTHTSACGVTAYRGDLWDAEFQHSVFACEPVGHLVTRSIVEPQQNSPALDARRARPAADFLASSDTWFRPGSLRTGPDGALYLTDMYRMWVEHPKFLPPEIAERINWRAGEDRGRIWRIVPEQTATRPAFVAPKSNQELVNLLKDNNGWTRQMAQQRLVESTDEQITALLRELLNAPGIPDHARIHALWCLQAKDSLTVDDRHAATERVSPDGTNQLQEQLLALNEGRQLYLAVRDSAGSSVSSVRFKTLLACASDQIEITPDELMDVLLNVTTHGANQPWFADALLLAVGDHSPTLLSNIVRVRGEASSASNAKIAYDEHRSSLIFRLSELLGKTGQEKELAGALSDAVWTSDSARWMTVAILKGLASGLPRNKNGLKAKSLAAFLENSPESARSTCQQVKTLLDRMTTEALDRARPVADRTAAVELLELRPQSVLVDVIGQLLVSGQVTEIEQAAIETARRAGGVLAANVVLAKWANLTPAVRSSALGLLMSRTETTTELLTKMQESRIPSSVIDIDQRVRLLQHRDENIRKLAGEIFGGVVSANRKEVADKYQPAISMQGSVERGRAVYEKTCSKCHKIGGKGHNVGPDISDTRRRSRDALLYDILDPNRRVDPQFTEYIVVTSDGRSFNGLLVSDSGEQIVLRQPEGREQTIARSEIDEMQATTKSLMPEGVEKDVSVEQMADLLEFLKAR